MVELSGRGEDRITSGAAAVPQPAAAGARFRFAATLVDWLRDLRNRKVSDPKFRRWATRFFLTRRFARQQAGALFDLTAGFVYSQVLFAAVRVRLFDLLAPGPLDLRAIASAVALPEEGAQRLLRAAVALRLAERRSDGRFALGALGAALVDNPGVIAMIEHHSLLYRDLTDPLPLLAGRGDAELGRYWTYAGQAPRIGDGLRPAQDAADYTALMAASQALVASEVVDAYPFRRHRRLLDVGGGDGSFLIAVAKAAPGLQLGLFDLPDVAAIARAKILAAGLSARTTITGGDFREDPLPAAADLVTLNRILHDHDEATVVTLLRAIRRAIAPGGTLLVVEPMAETPGAEASGDAYFGFYLMAMGQGRPRSPAEIIGLLGRAGFSKARLIATSTPLIARMIAATAAPRAGDAEQDNRTI